jgi:hypothetical protein
LISIQKENTNETTFDIDRKRNTIPILHEKHLLQHKLFTTKQFGFIRRRSTSLQLLRVLDNWTEGIDMGYDIDCIYMDYQKAFNMVPHRRLLQKL